MYAQLGTVLFQGLKGFDSFRENEAPNFAELALVENKPRLQRVGDNLIGVEITVRLNRAFTEVDADIQTFRDAMNLGLPLPLILGNGRFVGTFVIRSLAVDVLQAMADGTSVDSTVTMPLLEFVEPDPVGSKGRQAKANGFAIAANKPRIVTRTPPVAAPALVVAANVREAQSQANVLASAASEAQASASRAEAAYRKGRKAVAKAQDAMKTVEETLLAAEQLQTQAQAAVSQVQTARRNLENAKNALEAPVDINDLTNASRSVQFSMSNVVTATSPISVLATTRQ
jgi:phage protein U